MRPLSGLEPANPLDREARPPERPELAVNVIGYLNDTLGGGEAARLYVDTLNAAGISVSTTAVRPGMPQRRGGAVAPRHGHRPFIEQRASTRPAFNLVCLNGEDLGFFVRNGGAEQLGDRLTIGQWAWETDVLPETWTPGFEHLREIWVNSTFVAEILGPLSPVPVVVVPQGLSVPVPVALESEFAHDERFTFMFMMDFFSTVRRKNPIGLVDAFTRAFAAGEGPRLVLKTINGPLHEQAAAELRDTIGDRPDIELIDGYLEPLQKNALLARADCYVSLHRSEGFGLTLAESMALGTPVIATGYSGNTDFMTAQNSYLVDWTPTSVGPGSEIYPARGRWAEPDLDHAADLMRRVWERPDEAATKAQHARADIDRLYRPEVVGAIARNRLERLLAAQTVAGAHGLRHSDALRAVRSELAVDIRRGVAPEPGGPAGFLRRLVLRLIAPFTYHERKLDQAVFDSLCELRSQLETERQLRMRDGGRLRRVEDALAREDKDAQPD